MDSRKPQVIVSPDAIDRLPDFCRHHGLQKHVLVADSNTWRALGDRVEKVLSRSGWDVTSVVLEDQEVIVDARHILKVLLSHDAAPCTFVAIGSGTITDITRFVSHRTGNPFISLPTAPSVDGYTSTNVPMIVDGIKQSCTAHAPLAIFADTAVLAGAPRPMIAAGFGDMLGKYTSVADWRLGHLLWGQPYDEAIARRALAAADACAESADTIGRATAQGIARLMEALVESGFCMTDFGSSLPASGAEHHYSHAWEMKLLREGRPPILHGAKVGAATVIVAGLYDRIRGLSRGDVWDLLSASLRPEQRKQESCIEAAFGPQAREIEKAQACFLEMSEDRFQGLKRDVVDHWAEVLAIAAGVPPAEKIAGLLERVGGAVTPLALGLNDDDIAMAAAAAHYLRPHFTVRKLTEILFPGDAGTRT